MKTSIIAIVTLMISCAENTTQSILEQTGMEEIAKMRFDTEAFEKNKKRISDYDQIYEFTDSLGALHSQVSQEDFYYETITYPDSLICDIYVFYSTGNIKFFGRSLVKGNANVGNELHFAENGDLIKIVDNDEHHPFTLEQVLDYMKANNLDIWDENIGIFRRVEYFVGAPPPNPYSWIISINIPRKETIDYYITRKMPIPSLRRRTIELDAVTGKVICDKTEEYEYN